MMLSRLKPLIWLPLLPVLFWQGLRVKRRALRLPEAGGAPFGTYPGSPPEIRLLIVGESPVCGVGVEDYEESLGAHIAGELARLSGRQVHWRADGINGITLAEYNRREHPHRNADMVIVSFGVNDSTGLTRRRDWYRELVTLRGSFPATPMYFMPVPPMQDFPLLPSPLRHFLGQRAQQLAQVLQGFCQATPGVCYAELSYSLMPEHIARDGYHPSAEGCVALAKALAPQLLQTLTRSGNPDP